MDSDASPIAPPRVDLKALLSEFKAQINQLFCQMKSDNEEMFRQMKSQLESDLEEMFPGFQEKMNIGVSFSTSNVPNTTTSPPGKY